MAKRRGRPPKAPGTAKAEYLQVRVHAAEKRSFHAAAELAGLDLSSWVRERLRMLARKELEKAGQTVPFLNPAKDSQR
jgi:uncharacterized protein (DUF1778 family)